MRELHKGSISSHLVYLSWPMIVGNILQNFLAIFETFLIGKLGVLHLAALAIIGPIISFFWAIEGGLITGVIAFTARLAGEEKYNNINVLIIQAFLSGIIIIGFFCLLTYLFLNEILGFFSLKYETAKYATEYIQILFFSFLNLSIFFVFIGVLRGVGDSITPLKLISTGAILNIILAPIFILGIGDFKGFGIKGGALANLIGFLMANLLAFSIFLKGKKFLKISLRNLKIDFDMLKRYLKISIKAMGQGIYANIGYLGMMKIASIFGDLFLAALGIGLKLNAFIMMFGWPIGNSGGIIVGHNIGKKFFDRVKETVKVALSMYSIITISTGILFFIFARNIMNLFTQNIEVILHGVNFLKIIAPSYLFMGVALIIHAGFNGAGATHIPTNINFWTLLVFQIGIAILLINFTLLKENSIAIAISSSFIVQGIISWIIYKKEKWLQTQI